MTAPLVVPVAGYMILSRFVRCRSRPATSSSLGMACLLRRCGGGALPSHLRLCAQLLPPVDPRRCAVALSGRVFAPPVAKLALDGFPGGMRAIWSGSIAFGLVNVPVKAYTAVREHDLRLHQVHDKDHGRIRYERHCEICGELVDFKHIQRAYDDGSTTVIITDEDLKELPAAARGEIDVVRFVPAEQIDLITLDGSYYLKPDSKAAKAYALLLHTLQETNRTAIVTFALRQKTRLGVLRVREGDLVLQSMTWPDEVRAVESPDLEAVELTSKEKDLASALVDHMTGDFDPDEFEDEYQVELRQLVEARLEEGEAVDTAATFGESDSSEPVHGKVVDLMEALQRSIDKGKAKGA